MATMVAMTSPRTDEDGKVKHETIERVNKRENYKRTQQQQRQKK